MKSAVQFIVLVLADLILGALAVTGALVFAFQGQLFGTVACAIPVCVWVVLAKRIVITIYQDLQSWDSVS